MQRIPGPADPRPWQTYRWLRRPTELLADCRARYGDIFQLRCYGDGDMVVVAHPDAIRAVFAAGYEEVHQPKDEQFGRLLGPSSLFVAEGNIHQAMRKVVLPALGQAQVKRHIDELHRRAVAAVAKWPSTGWFDLQVAMQDLLLQTTLLLLFGAGAPERLTDLGRVFADTYAAFRSPFMLVPIGMQARLGRGPWERLVQLSLQARAIMTRELVRCRRHAQPEPCVLASLLQAEHAEGRPLTDAEICDSLLALFIAGHDTTANALSWALDCLLHDPPSHQLLSDEVSPRLTQSPRWEEVLTLPYLDAVVREVLRLRPIFPVTTRTLREPMSLLGHDLPAGTVVVPCIYLAQRREDVFPDPHRFRPERFFGLDPVPFEWMPFGGGVRRCAGSFSVQLQMKVLLASIVASAQLERQPGPAPRMVRAFISLAPDRGVKARVLQRRALRAVGGPVTTQSRLASS
ncbi:MAG TPA: cytochrome P450 [Pseudomonadota bacterium]|nr:cytochrome P450 [Pseudomonadota bacterium]